MGELYHYGVKGMKWGVRKAEYKAMSKADRKKTRQDYRSDEKWKRKTLTNKNYWEAFDKARREISSEAMDVIINRKDKNGNPITDSEVKKFESRYNERFNELLSTSIKSVVKSSVSKTGRYEVDMILANKDFSDMPYMVLVDNLRDELFILNTGRTGHVY